MTAPTAEVYEPRHFSFGENEFFVVPLVTGDPAEPAEPVVVIYGSLLGSVGVFQASISGPDRPGVLAFAAELFRTYRVQVAASFGKRLDDAHASQFEFDPAPDNANNVRRMFGDLVGEKGPLFVIRALNTFDRVFDLDVRFARGGVGVACPVASLLAERGVNLRFFEERRVETGGVPGFPEVRFRATLELPAGLDSVELFRALKAALPTGATAGLNELYRIEDGQVVKGRVVLSL